MRLWRRRLLPFLLAAAAFTIEPAISAEVEKDKCSCKIMQVGATSTLSGGTCTRTESDYCLMEWQATSAASTNVGNGEPQAIAIVRTYGQLTGTGNFVIDGLAPLTDAPTDDANAAQNAVLDAVRGSPFFDFANSYQLVERYLLLAAAALSRFDAPVEELLPLVGADYSDNLTQTLAGEPGVPAFVNSFGPFKVSASGSCLAVDYPGRGVLVTVKGPGGDDATC